MLGLGDDLLCFFYPLFFNQIIISRRHWIRISDNRLDSRRWGQGREWRQDRRSRLSQAGRVARGTSDMLLAGLLLLWLLRRLLRLVDNRKSLTPLEVSRTVLWCTRW